MGHIGTARWVKCLFVLVCSSAFSAGCSSTESYTAATKDADPHATETFIGALADKDAGVRYRAVVALGETRDERAVGPLIVALKDYNVLVQEQAANALGKIKDPRAIGPLIEALGYASTSNAAEDALRNIGAPAIPALIAAFKTDNYGSAEWILGTIGTPAVLPLIAALNDPAVRRAAVSALGYTKDPRAVAPLITALGHGNIDGQLIAGALQKIGEPAVTPLIAALKDPMENTREHAAMALGYLRDPRAIEPLLAALRDKYPDKSAPAFLSNGWDFGDYVADALRMFGPAAVPQLVASLDDQDVEVRRKVVKALIGTRDSRAIFSLFAKLHDPDNTVRKYAAQAVGRTNDSRVIEILVAALPDPNDDVRAEIAGALGNYKDSRAFYALFNLLTDRSNEVVFRASLSLVKYGEPGSTNMLVKALDQVNSVELAEVYLNSSNTILEVAARTWANRHGVRILPTPFGRASVTWGKMN